MSIGSRAPRPGLWGRRPKITPYDVIVFDNNSRLERKIDRLERKIDLILRHLQIEDPDVVDFTEIDDLLRRNKKVQAIRRFRQLDPAAGLKEAADAVEARAKAL